MTGKKAVFFCLVGAVCMFPSCKPGGQGTPGRSSGGKQGPALAQVGDEVITVEAFESDVNALPEYTRKRMKTAEQKRKHLEKMIDEILLLQEAEKRNLDKDKDILAKVDRYRKRLITEKLYRQIASERAKISEKEIQDYYQEHKDRFRQPERIRVRQILILVPPNAGPEKVAKAKKKAEEVLARVKAGEDFAELAKKYSEGPTAGRGGDLGYFTRGRMVPAFEKAAFSLKKVGDTSGLVRTKFGFHIIELTGRQPARELPLEEARDRIVRQLESAKRREIRRSLAEELRKKANVKVDETYFEKETPSEG